MNIEFGTKSDKKYDLYAQFEQQVRDMQCLKKKDRNCTNIKMKEAWRGAEPEKLTGMVDLILGSR